MKRILVPCDFSKPAVNAFRLAYDLASKSGGTVHLLHVIEMPVLHDTVLMPVLNFEQELFRELREKAEEEFKKLKGDFKNEEAKVVSKIEFGLPSRMILDYIKDNEIDIVVMGSHGATGLREFFIGSNAEKIVRHSPVPVLVAKDYPKDSVKRIVFPNTLDTEHQEDLVMKVKALQNFFSATLHIVWINTPVSFTSDSITHERLNAFAKRYMLKDYTIHVYNHPDEEEGILKFTKLINGNLIAMGTHGRKGIAHFLNGSLAEDIVNHTDSLIWTYTLKNETPKA
ncbi:MAG TPA: universal stress protein [Ohtaekwangia sp.]